MGTCKEKRIPPCWYWFTYGNWPCVWPLSCCWSEFLHRDVGRCSNRSSTFFSVARTHAVQWDHSMSWSSRCSTVGCSPDSTTTLCPMQSAPDWVGAFSKDPACSGDPGNDQRSSTIKYCLKFFKLPKVKHWTEMVFVGLGDQAHLNRPKGGSTGGLLIFLSNSDLSIGLPAHMILVSLRSWKLQRVAIGTNDAEVQSLVEAEDVLFRSRLLWVEINGGGTYNIQKAVLEASELEVCQVTGLLVTDSKGGYDSIIVNESPLLGLSNTRAALQAWQLKEALPRCGTRLMWLASDWNLADCMTKKKPECRTSMSYFFKRRIWMLKFDPNFVQSSRKEKKAKGSPIQQLSAKAHDVKSSENFSGDASHQISYSGLQIQSNDLSSQVNSWCMLLPGVWPKTRGPLNRFVVRPWDEKVMSHLRA